MRTVQVFEEFVLGALRLLLPSQSRRYQDELIASLDDLRHTLSMSGMNKCRALLVKIGRQDVWPDELGWSFASVRDGWTAMMRHDRRLASLLSDVVSAAFAAEPSRKAPETGPKYLSAVASMSGMLESPASDVHVWKGDGSRRAEVQELLRVAASVFGLPAGRLAGEARGVREAIMTLSSEETMLNVLGLLPKVDPPEPTWRRAAMLPMDDELLEAMIHHGSSWVSRLAAIFLNERLEKGQTGASVRADPWIGQGIRIALGCGAR